MAEMNYINSASLVDESFDYIDSSRIDVSDKFFYYDNTGNYFPILHFDADNIPVGNSSTYCVFLMFIEKENKKYKDNYRNFVGFPQCSNAFNPKFRW